MGDLVELARRAEREGLGDVVAPMLRDYLYDSARAAKFYEQFHWGDQPRELVESSAGAVGPDTVLVQLGELAEVAYEATKGGEHAVWVHAFRNPRPVLAYSMTGQLVIAGGGYRVTARGIID